MLLGEMEWNIWKITLQVQQTSELCVNIGTLCKHWNSVQTLEPHEYCSCNSGVNEQKLM